MVKPALEIRLPTTVWLLLALGAAVVAMVQVRCTIIMPDTARLSFDSAEYALAGRAWLETGRLVTPFVHPAALGSSPGPPYPLLVGHPLVPALDALAFALAGPDAGSTVWPAVLAFVITVLLTSRLALALTGSRAGAIAAGAAFAVSPWALRYAAEGLSEMPFAAAWTGALLLLLELPRRPRPVLMGVLLGLAHLARPVAVPLLPAFVLGMLLSLPARDWLRSLALAVAGFAPFALLIFVYKWSATGMPFADGGSYLLLTGVDPAHAVARMNRMAPPPDALEWIRDHPLEWLSKVARGIRSIAYTASGLAGRLMVAAACLTAAVVMLRGERRARGFVLTVGLSAAMLLLLSAATVADARMLFPLLPPAIALAFAGLVRVAEGLGRGHRAVVHAAVALAALSNAIPTAIAWQDALTHPAPARGAFREREWRGIGVGVRPMLPANVLVASDAAPWIAWFVRTPVTLVPLEPHTLTDGPERLRPGAVVLTNEWLIRQPGEQAWRAMLEQRTPPPGFVFSGHVRSGRLEAVVFTRTAAP